MGFGTAAVFAFSGNRQSHVDHNRLTMPDAPDPETLKPVPDHKARPPFTRHFDMRPTTGPRFDWKSAVGEYLTWVRFVEEPACHQDRKSAVSGKRVSVRGDLGGVGTLKKIKHSQEDRLVLR